MKKSSIKIDIVKTYEKDDNSDRDLIYVLPSHQQEEIIIAFQDVAYQIYNDLLDLPVKVQVNPCTSVYLQHLGLNIAQS